MDSSEPGGMLLPLLDGLDAGRLREVLAGQPELAVTDLGHIPGHPLGTLPLSYVAMLRFDTATGRWRDVPGTGELASVLLGAGAPVDGEDGASETTLITAASYGDAEVARVLIAAGADLEAISAPTAGGIPSASPLSHAAIFGMTDVVDVLVSAGATVTSVVLAAAAGDLSGWELAETSSEQLLLALIMAADHERLDVIDQLVAAGAPIDAPDPEWGRQALRLAAENGRPASIRHLLALGADPSRPDSEGRTALDLCVAGRRQHEGQVVAAYDQAEALLRTWR